MTKQQLLSKKVALITLGCDKNTVDAEKMMYLLSSYGFNFTSEIEQANIAIVNTCAFIESSKKESIDKILETAQLKNFNLEKLIVTGCLPQRYYDDVNSMPEVDACVRLKNNEKIIDIICGLYGVENNYSIKLKQPKRMLSTPKHYAFLKIADGCNNFCSYCTIPFIRGRYKSVPPVDIIDEAKALVKQGVKELILVAQDVTNYGTDLFGSPQLVPLLKELSKIKKLEWIRLHYCYPHLITDELLTEIDTNPKICKYLDIPLQHISTDILKSMNRKESGEDIKILLDKIRKLKNYVSVRSTFIVGYPGETKKDFNQLLNFLVEYKLDNVGFFTYSREQNTKAYKLPHQILERTKQKRLNEVQQLQHNILLQNQQNKIGAILKAVCDDIVCDESGLTYVLRTEYNSVDVDTLCFVKSKIPLKIGEFYKIKITDCYDIDLIGEVVGG